MTLDAIWGALLRRTNSALLRLRVFPFTLVYMVINAAVRVAELRHGRTVVRMGELTGETTSLTRSVLLWLDRVAADIPELQFDICLRVPRDAADVNLQEVLSVLFASPRLRSAGMYWDSSSLADDLPLWQAKESRDDRTAGPMPSEDLGTPSFKQLEEFFRTDHAGMVLPVAAARDARTLLKRQAGPAFAVCLNMPLEHRSLIAAVEATRPDIRFFDLTPTLPTTSAGNSRSLYGCGLNLHERMALVQAADAYIGSFDELGCAALMSNRLAVLLGGGTGEQPDRISRGNVAVWFPGPVEQTSLAGAVLQFLPCQIEQTEN